MGVSAAQYVKLPNGKWGARVPMPVQPGDTIHVRKVGPGGHEKRTVFAVVEQSVDYMATVSLVDIGAELEAIANTPATGPHRHRTQCVCGTWLRPGQECWKCES